MATVAINCEQTMQIFSSSSENGNFDAEPNDVRAKIFCPAEKEGNFDAPVLGIYNKSQGHKL